MKMNPRGFTIAELFVALFVFGIISLMAFAFFAVQSKTGGTVAKEMQSDEAISLAMTLMRRDIIHAQNGLTGLSTPAELVFWVTDERGLGDGFYHELYINYGRYLTSNTRLGIPTIFTNAALFLQATAGGFTIPGYSVDDQRTNLANINAAIFYSPGSTPSRGVRRVVGTPAASGFDTNFTFLDGTPPGSFAPATVYRFIPGNNFDCTGADPPGRRKEGFIERNCPRNPANPLVQGPWVPNDSDPKIVLGGTAPITVQEFRIRCQFVLADGVTLVWSTPNLNPFDTMPARNLRLIEITIRYRHLDLASEVRYEQSLQYGKTIRQGARVSLLDR